MAFTHLGSKCSVIPRRDIKRAVTPRGLSGDISRTLGPYESSDEDVLLRGEDPYQGKHTEFQLSEHDSPFIELAKNLLEVLGNDAAKRTGHQTRQVRKNVWRLNRHLDKKDLCGNINKSREQETLDWTTRLHQKYALHTFAEEIELSMCHFAKEVDTHGRLLDERKDAKVHGKWNKRLGWV